MQRWITRLVDWVGGHELATLLRLLVMAVTTWGFIALTSAVVRGRTRTFDERILLALRVPGNLATPIGPEWLTEVARDLTALGSTVVLILGLLGVAGFLLLDRRLAAMYFVLAAVTTGWLLSLGLKAVVDRPRPMVVPHLVEVSYSSFPSGHSMMSAVVYGTLGASLSSLVTLRRLKFYFLSVAVFLAGVVGLTRIYLGVHYPTDVLGGWSAGLTWSIFCWLLSRSLIRSHVIEPTLGSDEIEKQDFGGFSADDPPR